MEYNSNVTIGVKSMYVMWWRLLTRMGISGCVGPISADNPPRVAEVSAAHGSGMDLVGHAVFL